MNIDEPVMVDLSAGRVPLSFRWRGVTYAVVGPPEPWLSRRPWWHDDTRATRGHTLPIDVPTWRVDAIPLGLSPDATDAGDGTYDLACYPEGWRLIGAINAHLAHLLFA